jgi:hypothetical protein
MQGVHLEMQGVHRLSLRLTQKSSERDKGNLDQVQGVHNVKKRPSVEEPEQRNARRARRIYFQEILRTELSKSKNARSAWEVEIL